VAILLFQMIGRRTLLYPERKGQAGGRIDPGIAILDGVGLLLFTIPGVIAFGVDFTTGVIYLPSKNAKDNTALARDGMVVTEVNPADFNLPTFGKILRDQTGETVRLTSDKIQIYRLEKGTKIQVTLGVALFRV
jgi:hypothetical protein